jgi:dihydroorotase
VGLKGAQLADYAALHAAGAVMITDDGIPVVDAHLQRRACEYASELGLVVQTHSEDPSLRQGGVMHEGAVSHALGLPGNPAEAESIMIFRDCEIARMTGARVHIAHVSSERGMRVIEWFREQGAPVTCEVTPHHLTLTDEAWRAFDPVVKVAPPLRTAADVAYLRDALRRGVVDCIGTDHAPHTRAEKDRDALLAPFGLPNIEVAFPLLYTDLVLAGELALERLLELMQAGPAGVMGWVAPTLAPGAPADVVLLDLEREAVVDPLAFRSKAKFSPWAGRTLRGWPSVTIVAGRVAFDRAADAA